MKPGSSLRPRPSRRKGWALTAFFVGGCAGRAAVGEAGADSIIGHIEMPLLGSNDGMLAELIETITTKQPVIMDDCTVMLLPNSQ